MSQIPERTFVTIIRSVLKWKVREASTKPGPLERGKSSRKRIHYFKSRNTDHVHPKYGGAPRIWQNLEDNRNLIIILIRKQREYKVEWNLSQTGPWYNKNLSIAKTFYSPKNTDFKYL
jgi:hypothetical protein